ncbi:MAG: aspartate--tRNA ligase [Candidatus Woesearchaeota archaeon]|jgi:aspartyl-tRNA synthetase|nr:aspartate--tRNA ligase [Candidatus Woesearchaeota archaeon]MDP6265632.1 aspartate--tRNA ligase [Candidatus Woesearchaeota archaeon]MDP7322370.1 aspartate--tRNA ligase [Candidatus Woesearchaeota archaeon]MDP7476677.1 aspartate--tRNA ligase [Candidatus Woesearchaeota archaeon]HJO01859.1 aspartate--tRNA ligase [Candidatus Woesearchaeota archaeon]|tara:strand:- start:123 stop:1880 length:1758 start_codon:yes stop_codon:yes gene_type:complete
MKLKRTNTCGKLTKKSIKKKVVLSGWVSSSRDHGGIIFIDLRDRYGLTQVVFDPEHDKKTHKEAERLRREDVISVQGKVRARGKGLENPKLKTGEIEVLVDELEVLSKAETPPLEIDDRIEANEDLRLKYRYLDLRRPVMQKHLLMRNNAAQAAREYLNKNNFLEIETPILVRATPEGARDYIVPSRINPGKFYALPQSPQLYKQILMVSGCDRYYQMARCLRDEDLRQDRQPEHTQIDVEMSFVNAEDVIEMVEGLYKYMMKKVLNVDIKYEFPKISHKDAMDKYGCDKPDLRFGLELTDVTDIAKSSDFNVFNKAEKVKCINPEDKFSRNEIDDLIDFAISIGSKGMAWMRVTEKGLESNIAKFFNKDTQKKLIEKTKAKKGTILFFIADNEKNTNEILSKIRVEVGKRLKLINEKEFKFCWVVDFPLFEWDEDEKKWMPSHHIFTAPKKEHIQFLDKNPGRVYADLYDLVLNGLELGSGSIRETNPVTQEKMMKIIGLSHEEARKKFGFLMEAFKYGTPPHGGMGLGFDRIVALMCGYNDIREVIAFPKNKDAECPMDNSPSDVPEQQIKELNIKLDLVKKK